MNFIHFVSSNYVNFATVSKKKSNAKVARFLDLPFPDHPGNSPVLPEMAQTIPPFPESPTISPFAPFPESPTFSPDLPPFPTIPPFPDSPTILSFPHSPTISPFPDSPTIAPFTDSPTIAPFPDSPTILPFPDSPTIPPFPDSLPFPEFSIIPSFPDSSFIQPFPDSPSIQHFPDSLTVPPFPENAQPFPSFPKAMEDRSKLKSNQKRIVYVDLKTNISETPESSNSTIGMSTDRANDRRKQPLKFHRLGDAREVDPSFFVVRRHLTCLQVVE